MRRSLLFILFLPILLLAQQYQYINGLQFPSNGDDPSNKHIAIQFLNPQNDGLPIWGADHGGTTWVWEYYPFQQTGYYVTFFWADNGDNWHEAYYGCHPFPIPPSAGSGTSHYWELAGMANGRDNTNTRDGGPLVVVKERWYKQALRIHVNPDGSKQAVFYIDLPDTSNKFVIDVTSDAGWGETNPPNPVVVFGSAPWANSERLSGILGRIKIFNKEISGPDILEEAANMNILTTAAGQNNIWWGITSFDNVDDLGSDYGTGRTFEWATTYKAKVVAIDSIALNPGNESPKITDIPDQTISEGAYFADIALDDFVEDVDDADNTLTWEITGNTELGIHINSDRILTITVPGTEWNGRERLFFKVSDPGGLSDTSSTLFAVEPVNDPPYFTAALPNLTFNEDDSLQFAVTEWYPYADDIDNADSELNYIISGGKNVHYFLKSNTYSFSADHDWSGSETLQLIVSDGLLSDTASFSVVVNAVNDPPEIINLPETIHFRSDSSAVLMMNEYAKDIDSPLPLLSWNFAVSNDSLVYSFDSEIARLQLTAPDFSGSARLFCTLSDDSSARIRDTVLVSVDPVTAIRDMLSQRVPKQYELQQNYPNPFNPVTHINYSLPRTGKVRIAVYTLLGKNVEILLDTIKPAGYYSLRFDASRYSSGIYIYQIQAGNFVQNRKMILMK